MRAKRLTVIEKCEVQAARLENGSAVSVDKMTARKGYRAVAWRRDGRRELAVGTGETRTKAATALLQKLAHVGGAS